MMAAASKQQLEGKIGSDLDAMKKFLEQKQLHSNRQAPARLNAAL